MVFFLLFLFSRREKKLRLVFGLEVLMLVCGQPMASWLGDGLRKALTLKMAVTISISIQRSDGANWQGLTVHSTGGRLL